MCCALSSAYNRELWIVSALKLLTVGDIDPWKYVITTWSNKGYDRKSIGIWEDVGRVPNSEGITFFYRRIFF